MKRSACAAVFALLVMALGLIAHVSTAYDARRFFPETRIAVRDPFLSFWQRGGVELFGYPISLEMAERNPDDGHVYTVQYFERARLEWHPGATPEVQLGRLGAQRVGLQVGAAAPAAQALQSDCLFFPETTQQLCGAFASFWQQNGGVELFGYPLNEPLPAQVDGRQRLIQYTERARFELDTASGSISLGQLGREQYGDVLGDYRPAIDPVAQRLLELVNAERAAAGLAPVTIAPALMSAAQAHSQDMASSGQISHTGSDGRGAAQRMADFGYDWARCGENIAVGQTTPEEAMHFWMHSPPHRANILDAGMQEIGIGYVQERGVGGYGYYWTINLGQP
jgi:uncharacterized protein YkwD